MPPLLSRSKRSLRLEFGPLDDHSDAKRQHWELDEGGERQVNERRAAYSSVDCVSFKFSTGQLSSSAPATRGCYANENDRGERR